MRRAVLLFPMMLAWVAAQAPGGAALAADVETQAAAGTGAVVLPPGFWATWGDGRAELDGYALTQPRYGQPRQGEAVLIYVAETFTAAQRVKSDGGHGDEYPVLKLNQTRRFQTGVYDYATQSSAWVRLDGRLPRGVAPKLSLSVQEWCGHVWSQLLVDPPSMRWIQHSYFDGEGDREQTTAVPEGGVMGDLLPVLLRGLVGELVRPGGTITVPYLPTLLDGRLDHAAPTWTQATIHRAERTTFLERPTGSYHAETWTVAVQGGLTTTWYVQASEPHLILGWERSDGETAVLTGTMRAAYWEEHDPGDEAMRARLGLPGREWPSGK